MADVISLKTGETLPPDFITRVDVNKMTDQQLDELLEAIRIRRMNSVAIYQHTQDELQAVQEEKAKAQMEKVCTQIIKSLNTLDKQFEKLETYVNKLRGLRIQAGMTVV